MSAYLYNTSNIPYLYIEVTTLTVHLQSFTTSIPSRRYSCNVSRHLQSYLVPFIYVYTPAAYLRFHTIKSLYKHRTSKLQTFIPLRGYNLECTSRPLERLTTISPRHNTYSTPVSLHAFMVRYLFLTSRPPVALPTAYIQKLRHSYHASKSRDLQRASMPPHIHYSTSLHLHQVLKYRSPNSPYLIPIHRYTLIEPPYLQTFTSSHTLQSPRSPYLTTSTSIHLHRAFQLP